MASAATKHEPRALGPIFRRSPFGTLREELRDFFSNVLAEEAEGWRAGQLAPSIDLSETDQALEARMDIPGMKPEQFDIQVNGNLLTVSGERKEEKEEKGRTYLRTERRVGAFSRTITLPCTVKEDKIDAQYKDGVLAISMPKTEEAKSRKIKVKS